MAGKGAKDRLGLSLCSNHCRMAVLLSCERGMFVWFQMWRLPNAFQGGAWVNWLMFGCCLSLVIQTLENGHREGSSPLKQLSISPVRGLRDLI